MLSLSAFRAKVKESVIGQDQLVDSVTLTIYRHLLKIMGVKHNYMQQSTTNSRKTPARALNKFRGQSYFKIYCKGTHFRVLLQYIIKKIKEFYMQPQKLAESQGIRLLRQLFLRGKRIFNMQDAKMVATLEKIPHNQLKKILSNLAKHGRAIKFIAILINCATLKLWEELGGFMNTIRFGRYVATPFTDIHSKLIFECQEITESYVPMELSLFLSIAKNWLASHFGYVVLNYNSVIIRMDNHKELFEIFKDHEVTIRSNEDFNLNKMNVNAMQKELGLNK